MTEAAEAEVVTDLVPITDTMGDMNLIEYATPQETISSSLAVAEALGDVIEKKGLASNISGRKYIRIEGWSLLAAMMNLTPHTTSEPVMAGENQIGWSAHGEWRDLAGRVVCGADSMVTRDEKTWKNRDDYALSSMAQTRALAKAMRMRFGFIATLRGYEATPAEEMPSDNSENAVHTASVVPTVEDHRTQSKIAVLNIVVGDETATPTDEDKAQAKSLWKVAATAAGLDITDPISRDEADALVTHAQVQWTEFTAAIEKPEPEPDVTPEDVGDGDDVKKEYAEDDPARPFG